MSEPNWVNIEAARARLDEIEAILAKLTSERDLIRSLLSPEAAGAAPSSPVVPAPGRRSRGTHPTMTSMLADVMRRGARGKGWRVGELIAELPRVHPEWTAPSNASAVVSAALAQAVRSKHPLFTSEKNAGGRGNVYRLS